MKKLLRLVLDFLVARYFNDEDVQWIVNDSGELGVKVHGRCFFLYKGGSLEYSDGENDDGTPILYRNVGKREFGETQWPASWLQAGRSEDKYTREVTYNPGLSFGPADNPDYKWKPLPNYRPVK